MAYEDESILRDLILLLRRGALTAAVFAVVGAAAVYLLSGALPAVFEARATMVATTQDPNQRDFGTTLVTAPPLSTSAYLVAIASDPVLADALATLAAGGAPTDAEVRAVRGALMLRAEGSTSPLVRVSVRDPDPQRAAALANAVAEAAVRWDQRRATRALESIIESLTAQIASIETEIASTVERSTEALERARTDLALQLSSARALRSGAVGRLELLELAVEPLAPVSPRPLFNALVAGLLAVFLTYGVLLVRTALDTRVRGIEDLARATGLPLLASFPKVEGGRRLVPTEAASYLRTAVGFAVAADEHPVLMVTSSGEAHGKSTVSMALAESYARQHYRVLLIDADLRKPVIGEEYGMNPQRTPTLLQALNDPASASPTTVALGRELSFDVLPSFEAAPHPTETLANHVRPLLQHVSTRYDVIVVDSAPVLPVADALVVAPHTTGVIFAVSMPDADRGQVTASIALLRRIGVRVLGTVATRLPRQRGRHGDYGQGYGYGYGNGAEDRKAAKQEDDRPGVRTRDDAGTGADGHARAPAPSGGVRPGRDGRNARR